MLTLVQLKRAELWNAPACARKGLEHYNDMNQGDEHELVEAVGVKSFSHCGPWLHANFLARRKGASSCDAVVPKYLFAELRIDADGLSCVSCFKMDSDVECARQRLSIPLVVCTLVPGRNDVFSLLPQVYKYRLVSKCRNFTQIDVCCQFNEQKGLEKAKSAL
ncbi:uncharacterized protein LOC123426810 [Hordeum vulgare subsp. vulgare]|uniref:uncharacterized protein LOC123426810 n=1 Tax=Hordeum vulgare subsp. vulgare TaxID=112509 RepID=UPI001D1A5A85|nr:uncharacterized protein LOC123426810 [Hordeum vulgare subsp. vulgare]